MQYMVSIDWFQLYCSAPASFDLPEEVYINGKEKNSSDYISQYYVSAGEEYHPIYSFCRTIKHHGFAICHIYWHPRSRALKNTLASVKVANRALYAGEWAFQLYDVINALGWKIENITRLDLCCDLKQFANGMTPKGFLDAYLREENRSLVDATSKEAPDQPSIIRKGRNKYFTVGTKRFTWITEDGKKKINGTANDIEYIRWGTRLSGVATYFYNKSKELREKKSKPYIQEAWQMAGFDLEDGNDIYRIEFSIQSKALLLLYNTPEIDGKKLYALKHIERICKDMLQHQKDLEALFWSFASKYFVFYDTKGHKDRRSMEEVKLFEPHDDVVVKPYSMNTTWDAGRAEHNASKVIQRALDNSHYISPDEELVLLKATSVLHRLGVFKKNEHEDIYNLPLHLYNSDEPDCQQMVYNGKISPSQRNKLRDIVNSAVAAYRFGIYEDEMMLQEVAEDIEDSFWESYVPDAGSSSGGFDVMAEMSYLLDRDDMESFSKSNIVPYCRS